jgi:ribonuclease VapC
MAETYVLDSYAILALLRAEAGEEYVAELLRRAQNGEITVMMNWVNLGEVAYIVERRWGRGRLIAVLGTLEATNIRFVPAGRNLALGAARIKAAHPLAYADAHAAALAIQEQAILVTGDPEFDSLSDEVNIHWINRTAG